MKRALLLAVTGAVFLQLLQQGAVPVHAQTTSASALGFFKNYFITGDYVVGGIGLRGKGDSSGVASGTINITGVPAGADVVAAFLYWQVVATDPEAGAVGATFNGRPLSVIDGVAPDPDPFGKLLTTEGAAPCWASGGTTGPSGGTKKTYTYRADVLRLLDIDEAGTGRFIVNGPHAVQVPDTGNSNKTPVALGASLVVVYRDTAKPLSAIVIYDGGYTLDNSTPTMFQSIKGFYQAVGGTNSAKLTHIVGSGQVKKAETLLFNGATLATSPFSGAAGENWDNPTFAVSVGANASEVTTAVTPSSDCLTWGATIFGTPVVDSDSDGLLDVWETAPGLKDPNGVDLPYLGSDPNKKDIFVEIDYLETAGDTAYGGVTKLIHSHRPSPQALQLVKDAFAKNNITVHFDVASVGIPESITVCNRTAGDPPWVCQFSSYPGTVGWKTGLLFLRDQRFPEKGDTRPPRNPNRRHMYRYALFAHAIGLPQSEEPGTAGFNVPRTNTGAGDFPGGDLMVTLGAFADIAGNPVGTPYMQAATLMHELGHALELRHGGEPFEPNCKPTYLSVMNYLYQLRGLWDDQGKVNLDFSPAEYFTIGEDGELKDGLGVGLPYKIGWYAPYAGSYLFGRPGVKIAASHCDGSQITDGAQFVRIDQRSTASLTDWNANGVADEGFYTQDVNFNGRTRPGGAPERLKGSNDWARIRLNQIGARRNTGGLYADMNGDLFVGPLSADVGRGDLGRGDLGRGDLGRGDLGRGDLGRGDLGRGDLGRGDLGEGGLGRGDLGRGDLGRGDLGGGDYFVNNPYPEGELDYKTAGDLAKTPPNEFRACVIGSPNPDGCPDQSSPAYDVRLQWKASNVGGVQSYVVYRVEGPALTPTSTWTEVARITSSPGQVDYVHVDDDGPLVNGQQYTYFAVAVYGDVQSDPSNLVTITAVKKLQFVGFLSPLSTAGTIAAPSDSGVHNFGRAVPLKWQLTQGGSYASNLNNLRNLEARPGTYSGGTCTALTSGPPLVLQLFDPSTLQPTGGSTYRYDSTSNTFQFNADTSNFSPDHCYILVLTLRYEDPPEPKATFIRFTR